MTLICLYISFFVLNIDSNKIPYLPDNLYSYELDYSFKVKPAHDFEQIDFTKSETIRHNSTPLPFVKFKLTLNVNPEEYRKFNVINNEGSTLKSKKVKTGMEVLEFDMGYAVDIKDRTGAHQFTIMFFDSSKESSHQIIIEFDENGAMFINEVERGKI